MTNKQKWILTLIAGILFALLYYSMVTAQESNYDANYMPLITNGNAPLLPKIAHLTSPGYKFVGAPPFVVCASDGKLRVGDYSIRPDGTQGPSVFTVLTETFELLEVKELRGIGTRGSLVGVDISRCGYGLLSINAPNDRTLRIIQE